MSTNDKQYAIGVDLGGTNTVFGVVSINGNIICEGNIKTRDYPTIEQFVEAGIECLKPLIEQVGGIRVIKGMGIGAPPPTTSTFISFSFRQSQTVIIFRQSVQALRFRLHYDKSCINDRNIIDQNSNP